MTNFRIDRFLTMFLFCTIKKKIKRDDKVTFSILMYHSISDEIESNVHPYFQINTSPERFEEHLKFLNQNEYSVLSLGEAVKRLSDNSSNSSISNCRPVVITFDDGYADFYTHAFPLLRKYNYGATVFLPTDMISRGSIGLRGKEHLSWDDVKELSAAGIDFGSHTATHSLLRSKKEEELNFELSRSKSVIEEIVGSNIDSFSYPYAFPEEDKIFISLLKDTLRKYGYKYGVSTRLGTASSTDDIFCLKRIPANTLDDIALFEAKLNGGYDWLGIVQRMYKKIMKQKKMQYLLY